MKNVKRILSMLLVSVMVLTLALPAFAADVKMLGKGQEFVGYKVLNVKDYDPNDPTKVIYELNPKYEDVLKSVTGKTTEKEILEYIEAADPRAFADALYDAIKTANLTADATSVTVGEDQVFQNLDKGFWLFEETTALDEYDEISSYMTTTVLDEDVEVTAKDNQVEHKKEIIETNDSTGYESDWQGAADYDVAVGPNGEKVGDVIPFRLTGVVSKDYQKFDPYYFCFQDMMEEGLTLNRDSIKVYNGTTLINSDQYNLSIADDQNFKVTFANLNNTLDSQNNPIPQGGTIYVEFTATLNENSVIGMPGNANLSRLIYSNNPNTDDYGETPWDIVVVFTYDLTVNKVDEAGEDLPGAGFTLYKWINSDPADQTQGDWVAVGPEQKGDAQTQFNWPRIDAGKYKLVETTPIPGYNTIDPIEFTVIADYKQVKDTYGERIVLDDLRVDPADALTNIIITPDAGAIEGDVINESGVKLPETGGMGTTLFYIIGAALMIGAGVVLVARRRVK